MLSYVLVFITVFALVALLLSLYGGGAAAEKKQVEQRLQQLTGGAAARDADFADFRKTHSYSSNPLLNRLLLKLDLVARLRDLLAQAKVDWTPARFLSMCIAAFLIPAFLVQLRTGVFALSLVTGLATGSTPLLYVRFKRNQRFDRFEQGLPQALDLIVSGLRSGHSLVSAISLVARESPDPIGPEFRICFDEQNYGIDLRAAMENLAKRAPIQALRIVITAILIQKETGGNLAEVLEKCGQVIRERFRLKKEVLVKTAQGRLTGLILTLLPIVLGVLIYIANPKNMSLLWERPMGLKMLYAAGGMTAIGGLIIRKIVAIRV